jgi:hypothetical protein
MTMKSGRWWLLTQTATNMLLLLMLLLRVCARQCKSVRLIVMPDSPRLAQLPAMPLPRACVGWEEHP